MATESIPQQNRTSVDERAKQTAAAIYQLSALAELQPECGELAAAKAREIIQRYEESKPGAQIPTR